MEVHFPQELQSKLEEAAKAAGCDTDELVRDVMSGYVDELSQVRSLLDNRYDDIKSDRVKPIDGEKFFDSLRLREDPSAF